MSSTLSTYKQPLNKENGKLGEEFEANLNASKEMVLNQGPALENQDKGKGISMVEDPEANQDKRQKIEEEQPDASEDSKYPKIFGVILEPSKGKRKEMVLDQGPASKNQDKGKGISIVEDPKVNQDKRKAIMEEEPDASEDLKIFGVILKRSKGKRKACYRCSTCDKTFPSPQALGGHQNRHKWERNIKQTIHGINTAMANSSYYNLSSTPTLRSFKPHQGESTTFNTGSSTLEIGNSSFQHPLNAGFNVSSGASTSTSNNISGLHRQMNESQRD